MYSKFKLVPKAHKMGRPEDFSSQFHPPTASGGYVLGSSKSTKGGKLSGSGSGSNRRIKWEIAV